MDIERERHLVKKAKESLDAFGELYDFYLPKIYAYIYNRVANKELAEDLTANTFIQAMDKLYQYNDRGYRLGAWLYRIAHNTVCDYFRANKTQIISYEDAMKAIGELASEESFDLEKEEHKKMVLDVLKQLPEDYQQILTLKFFEEMTNEEMAEIMNLKKETLAVKLHRSLQSFRKKFQETYNLDIL